MWLTTVGWVANSVGPDQTPRSAASDLGLHCLLRPVCPNNGKYITCKNGFLVISAPPGHMVYQGRIFHSQQQMGVPNMYDSGYRLPRTGSYMDIYGAAYGYDPVIGMFNIGGKKFYEPNFSCHGSFFCKFLFVPIAFVSAKKIRVPTQKYRSVDSLKTAFPFLCKGSLVSPRFPHRGLSIFLQFLMLASLLLTTANKIQNGSIANKHTQKKEWIFRVLILLTRHMIVMLL